MKTKSSKTWVLLLLGVVLLLLAGYFVILWRMRIFDSTTTNIEMAPILVLTGALFTSVVAVVGAALKYSSDIQSEKRLAQDVVVRAIQLLGTNTGAEIPLTQRAGVLFALADLGQLELSITLLGQMMQSRQIDGYTASCLLDKALKSNNKELQHEASITLQRHAYQFLEKDGHASFPACLLYKFNVILPEDVRENGVAAILELIIARPFHEWNYGVLCNLILTLFEVSENDKSKNIKSDAGYCLYKLLGAFQSDNAFQSHHVGTISIDTMKKLLEKNGCSSDNNCSAYFAAQSEKINQWVIESNRIPT